MDEVFKAVLQNTNYAMSDFVIQPGERNAEIEHDAENVGKSASNSAAANAAPTDADTLADRPPG